MRAFRLPDLGEGLEDAEIVAWHVGPGDRVVADQPLLSVETAKAVVEVPSPWSGRIAEILGRVGDIVKTGAVIVRYEDAEARATDAGTVVGELPEARAIAPVPAARPMASPNGPAAKRASPSVRQLARSLGVDLTTIAGSGPQGSVTRADVEAAHAGGPARMDYEPLRGVRRAMAINMARSAREVPGSTVTDEARVDHWAGETDVTRCLVEAVVAGCRAAPALNAWFDGTRLERRLAASIDIGIAMNGPDGLFVPVLHDAGRLGGAEIRSRRQGMKGKVAARTSAPADLAGATISLSNFGMLGGIHAALAIVPPQVAILGAGRIIEAVRPIAGEIRIARILPLSLTFDHRVVTGAEAVTFLNAVVATIASP